MRALTERGHTVRVLDNSSRGSRERLGKVSSDVEIVEGDIRDPAVVTRSTKGVQSICHLAFVNGTEFFYRYPAYVLDVGVKGMVNVLDAGIRAGVEELVLASSSEVYQTPPTVPTDESVPLSVPDPRNPRYSYGGGKIISELMTLHYGKEHFQRVLIFRPHNVYGPQMGWEHVIPQFVRRMQEHIEEGRSETLDFPIQGNGEQTRSFIYIGDFTEGLLLVIEKGTSGEIYHIGTMEEVHIRDVAERIASILGIRIRIVEGPEAVGGTPRRCPDNHKLQSLGFRHNYLLDQGLKPTVAWYRDHAAPAQSAVSQAPSLFL